MIDVLAIGTHPDDLELACGATLAKLVREGRTVACADLTQGELGTRGTKELRAEEAARAAKILGVKERRNLQIPDGNIEENQTNRNKIISLIRDLKPKVLFIPHSFDRHPDHVHSHLLCREAWFYSGLARISTKHGGEEQSPHRPDIWFEFMQWHEFTPSFIVDVTETWDIKMKAVRAYESQFYNPKSKDPETKLSTPSFLEFVEARGRSYGERIGARYGEPLLCPAPIGVKSIFDIVVARG